MGGDDRLHSIGVEEVHAHLVGVDDDGQHEDGAIAD